jgi:hypothetical protein
MASQLAEHAAIYFSSSLSREILDCFMLCHEIMVELKLKQHHEMLFLSEALPAQSKSI